MQAVCRAYRVGEQAIGAESIPGLVHGSTEFVTGKPGSEPWKEVIETNHRRKGIGVFQAVAQELQQSGIAEHRALVQEVEAFFENFPSIKARRDEIRETIQALKDKTKMEKAR